MEPEAAFNPVLRRIMVFGSSLAFGFAGASLEALQPGFSFHISWRTVAVFFIASTILYIYWRILLHPGQEPRQRTLRITASIFLALAGIAGFLYPLRFIAPNNYTEVIIGLVTAFCGLTGVAVLLICCKRFLDKDSRDNTR